MVEKEFRKNIAKNVKEFRKREGMNQKRFAEKLEMNYQKLFSDGERFIFTIIK